MKVIVLIFILAFGVFPPVYAGEWKDNFEDAKFTEKWWEPFPNGGQIGVGIWKKGWYSVKSTGDPNIAYSLLKVKVGGEFIKLHDGLAMEGTYVDSGDGPGRHAALFMLSYVSDEEAYLAGGFIGGWQVWIVHKVNPKPGVGFGQRQELVTTPMAGTKAGSKKANMIFKLKVEAKGNTVTVYIDGKEGTKWTFAKGLPKGRIGLAAVANNGHWDDFTISGPGLTVKPAGKLSISWGEIKLKNL